tara:strand:- start:20795 stop:21196 length:402 start_codon:yes stop_codon:yes gene_type:complete
MKKLTLLFILFIFISSCSEDELTYQGEILPINEVFVPSFFTANQVDTITVRYTRPNGCYEFPRAYYKHNGISSRVVAVKILKSLDISCSEPSQEMELKIPVLALRVDYYYFSFWMGEDENGNELFQDFSIPVN